MAGYVGNGVGSKIPQKQKTNNVYYGVLESAADTINVPEGYQVGTLTVFVNGIILNENEYNATNGTDVVLSESMDAGTVWRIEENAIVDSDVSSRLLDRSNHTGTQLASTVADLFEKTFRRFDTLQDLKADSTVTPGELVYTAGYNEVGDGGDNQYQIVDTTEGTNNGALVDLPGSTYQALGLFLTKVVPEQFGAVADGTTQDFNAFVELAGVATGIDIDLGDRTYFVSSVPTSNNYQNVTWVGNDFETFEQHATSGVVSGSVTTGALEPAYTGGVNNTPTVDGRTTPHLRAIMASQNCRADFARSACIASIYCWAYGNVSGNFASRQSIAGGPQTVNIGSEEGQAIGFQAGNYTTQFCRAEGSSTFNLGSDDCAASGAHSGTISSLTSYAGRGHDFRGTPEFADGSLVSVTIDNPGAGYTTNDTMLLSARQYPATTDAVMSFTVDSNGSVTSVTVTDGGSGYQGIVDVRMDTLGDYSIVAASARSKVENLFCAAIASDNARVRGRESAIIASDDCTTSDENDFVAGSTTSSASGNRSGVYSSTGSTASGSGSVVLGGVSSNSTHTGSIVLGRRGQSASDRSFSTNDAPEGSAATSNRKFEVAQAGTVRAAGTITGSVTFTDYAEMFPNKTIGEIPLGTLVSLDGNTVEPATGDDIIGVVSATALVIAGDTPFTWAQRYQIGKFGEQVWEDVDMVRWSDYDGSVRACPYDIPEHAVLYTEQHLVETHDFDPTVENVPRSQRPDEWSIIGLMGQVYVRVTKDVTKNTYLEAHNGIGIPSTTKTNLRCMKITTPYNEEDGYAIAFCLLK